MFYIVSNNKVVFRSANESTLRAKFNAMVGRGSSVVFTTIKPTAPKQSLNVSILSYTE